MMLANKLCLDNYRDVKKALVVQNAVTVIPALLAKLLVDFQLPSLLVFGL